ncbi:MAG: outer membrane lipoprotein carrier protein LolA [Firmicutes bacterium]|nr:outer membrane lipoprotein carrier protein LolA [Bacillota bacterium]
MKKIFLLLTGIFFSITVWAQSNFTPVSSAGIVAIKNAIKEKNSQINTMTCPFVQTKKMEILNESAVTKGVMYFKKTDKFRWEYLSEVPFVFVQNGNRFYTKIDGKVTEVKGNNARMFQEISKMVIASMNGEILEDTKKFKTEFHENNSVVVVTLTPTQKNMHSFIKEMKLYFSKKTYWVSKIEIFESENECTSIQFENIQENKVIADSIFELK